MTGRVYVVVPRRLRAADCQRMSAHAPNPRIRATLTDMARTWTRLAMEAEQTLKENRPPLQLVPTDARSAHASWHPGVVEKESPDEGLMGR